MSGALLPTSKSVLPGKLNLTQFIQTLLVGISGIPGNMVRPKWQAAPPQNPDIEITWISFGILESSVDANAYIAPNTSNGMTLQRQIGLIIPCSVYGPNAFDIAELLREGFQVPPNRDQLTLANMGFVEAGPSMHIPDLVNERFINRVETTLFMRRQIQFNYNIPTILSASGAIHTVVGDEEYLLAWSTGN